MKYKIAKTVYVISLAVLLSGCYPSEPKKISDNSSNVSFTNNLQSSVETSVYNENDINSGEKTASEVRSISLTLKKWDAENIEKTFLDGAEIVEKKEQECEFYPNEKLFVYDAKDERRVIFEPGRLIFDDKAALGGEYKYGTVFYYGRPPFAKSEELSAFSIADAQSRVNLVLDRLDITNYGEPVTVPVDADFANEILAYHKEKGQGDFDYTPWSENEEIYVLYYPLKYEGIELAQTGFQLPRDNWATDAPQITAVVSKDKIISIRASSIYSAEYDAAENVEIKCDIEQARARLSDFYSNLISDETPIYNGGKLVYVPYAMTNQMTVSFKPAWEFEGYTVTDYFPYKRECYQYFYADSGARYEES